MSNPFLAKPNYIRIFGHRGARGEIAENSIEGFKHTFALGIKAIEFDVVISKDKIPVFDAEIKFYNEANLLGTTKTSNEGIAQFTVPENQNYTTDEDGALVASIEIPSGLGSGNADLVLSGENADGSEVVVGLPVSLEMIGSSGGFTDSLLAGFLFAIGAMFIFLVLRKRRDADEIE